MSTKIPCEAIQDLLILYDDDACSEVTRKLVEEHLAKCEKCRKGQLTEIVAPILEPPAERETKAAKNSFKKMRNRWIASILAVLMLFPLTAVVMLGYNEVTGKGRAFTNWNEIKVGEEVLEMLAEGDYDGVLEYTTFHFEYEEALRRSEQTYDDYIDETYCSDYKEITINGEPWVCQTDWFDDYVSDPTVDGAGIDWEYLIYEESGDICYIPEDIFKETTGINDLTVSSDGTATAKIKTNYLGSEIYYRLETKWGAFMIREPIWEAVHVRIQEGNDTLDPLNYIYSALVPKSLYLETVDAMKEAHKESYTWQTVDYSRLVADGEEAFYANTNIAERYKEKLEALENGDFEITNITYDSSCRVDGEWIISYYVTLDCPDGAIVPYDYPVKVDFKTHDGKVRFAGYTYNVLGRDYHNNVDFNEAVKLFTEALASDQLL